MDKIALSLSKNAFQAVTLEQDIPKKVWVATIKLETKDLTGYRTIAVIINSIYIKETSKIDYLITNKQYKSVSRALILTKSLNRNYIEKNYIKAKIELGLKEHQLRDKTSFMRHCILVFFHILSSHINN